jgi:hypothetical protein
MRTLLFATFVASLLNNSYSEAQTMSRNEVQIGAGIYANEHVAMDMLENFVRSLFGSEPKTLEPKTMANLSYYYRVKPKIAVGMGIGYNSAEYRGMHEKANKPGYRTKTAVMAFEMKLYYKEKDNVSLYGGAGFGNFYRQDQLISYPDQTYSDTAITFQITPLGIRLGKRVGAFVELGYGYKGIANVGVSGRF